LSYSLIPSDCGSNYIRPERLDMERYCRLDISQGFFVGITFADNNTLNTKRVSDIAIRVPLHNDFDLLHLICSMLLLTTNALKKEWG